MFLLPFVLNSETIMPKKYIINYTKNSPEIDGIINEECWNTVGWGSDFTQFEPNSGAKSTQKTSFKVLYDKENIYVAIRCYDDEPNLIDKRLCRRDSYEGDICGVLFDSYNDNRTAFYFAVNAGGVKNDIFYSNDGNNQDMTWNPIWYVETATDKKGWTAEMKIPFSQLRFNPNTQNWGLNIIREIHRYKEISTWQKIDIKGSGWVSQSGILTGIKNLKLKRQIEIAPYFMSGYSKYKPEEGNPYADGNDFKFNAGLDGKIGITNDFTLDFTINPDFGQVEADPSDVNLTAFETFFTEKRPFFIENNNITSVGFGWHNENLFYSRRIGGKPSYSPEITDNEFIKYPESTKILGAVKFSGKSKNGWSIGVIESVTNREYAKITNKDADKRKESVEPLTNYFLARVQKDFDAGNTMIGGILTSTYRDIDNKNLLFLNKSATVGGLDFMHYWSDRKYSISGKFISSHITGTNKAMIEQQTNSRRYFQRPDADYLYFDSTLTEMTGTYFDIRFDKRGMQGLRYLFELTYRSPSFEVNDLGYLRKTDFIMQTFWIGYGITEPKGVFRKFNIGFCQWTGWNSVLEYKYSGFNIGTNAEFNNMWSFNLLYDCNMPALNYDLLRGGNSFKEPFNFTIIAGLSSNKTKKFIADFSTSFFNANYHYQNIANFSINLKYRPINRFSVSLNTAYNRISKKMQFVDDYELENENYYILSSLNQNTLNFTFRFDLNISTDITLQYYGAPFVSSADYYNYKNILNPNAKNFSDRYYLYPSKQFNSVENSFDFNNDGVTDYNLNNPDFNFQQFRSNLVFRWEYIPGSILFLVWSHQQTDVLQNGNFNFINDFGNLFKISPTDNFIIKFQYRFS